MKIDISVIMSVCNGGARLEQSIRSILDQSLRNIELIIIDDGSSDNTPDVLKSFADPRLRVFTNSRNIGLTKSLNIGLQNTSGKYIARQDADEFSLPERLEKQFAFMETNPSIFLTGTGTRTVDQKDKTTTIFRPITDETKLKRTLLKRCALSHPTIMFKNEKGLLYREKFVYAQDYDLYLNIISRNLRITNMPDILVHHRISPDAISFTKRAQQMLFAEKALEFFKQRASSGTDQYDTFIPENILNINMDTVTDPKLLGYEIEAAFKINNLKKVRSLFKKYVKENGVPGKYLIYYLASFFPADLLDIMRKSLWG